MDEQNLAALANYRNRQLAALREYVAWLEAHPEARIPPFVSCWQGVDAGEMAALVKNLGGFWEKEVDENDFKLVRKFGGITHTLYTPREGVCKRIVVGVEEREVEEPDPDAVAALPKVKRVEKVEKVEWECPESLSALAGASA